MTLDEAMISLVRQVGVWGALALLIGHWACAKSSAELALTNKCFNNIFMSEWWSYVWCYRIGVRQVHFDPHSKTIKQQNDLGLYSADESGADHQIFRGSKTDCLSEQTGEMLARYTEVTIECCSAHQFAAAGMGRDGELPASASAGDSGGEDENETQGTFILNVVEPVPCSYYMTVCSIHACPPDHALSPERKAAEVKARKRGNPISKLQKRKSWRKQRIDPPPVSARQQDEAAEVEATAAAAAAAAAEAAEATTEAERIDDSRKRASEEKRKTREG